ncbi:hypothetical protein M3Y99_01652700 [Aphelenchoides fujianensis]|nr:hypothetical protein M3Y99_01652700 [Aphelenchoides fujianensis]
MRNAKRSRPMSNGFCRELPTIYEDSVGSHLNSPSPVNAQQPAVREFESPFVHLDESPRSTPEISRPLKRAKRQRARGWFVQKYAPNMAASIRRWILALSVLVIVHQMANLLLLNVLLVYPQANHLLPEQYTARGPARSRRRRA